VSAIIAIAAQMPKMNPAERPLRFIPAELERPSGMLDIELAQSVARSEAVFHRKLQLRGIAALAIFVLATPPQVFSADIDTGYR